MVKYITGDKKVDKNLDIEKKKISDFFMRKIYFSRKGIKEDSKANKRKKSVHMRVLINKQNKRIEKLEEIIVDLNKKIDNGEKLENLITAQTEIFKQEMTNNNEELKRTIEEKTNQSSKIIEENTERIIKKFNDIEEKINNVKIDLQDDIQKKIEQEIIKMQENMKDEIRQDVISTQETINSVKIKITKDTDDKIKKMQKEINEKTKHDISKLKEKYKEEIEKIQEKMNKEAMYEIKRINNNTNHSLSLIKERIHEEIIKIQNEQNEIKNEEKNFSQNDNLKDKKTKFNINEDIRYEDLEKTAQYIIPLKKEEKETKEYNVKMRYLYGKYFRRNKIYNEEIFNQSQQIARTEFSNK